MYPSGALHLRTDGRRDDEVGGSGIATVTTGSSWSGSEINNMWNSLMGTSSPQSSGPSGQPHPTEPVSTTQEVTGMRHDDDTIFSTLSLEITDRLKTTWKETRFFNIVAEFA